MHWVLFDSPDQLAKQAALHILSCAHRSIDARGAFHLVLSGGTTPRRTYQNLSCHKTDWSRWHLYFGDERCLPAGDPERNSEMVRTSLTSKVPIPSSQIHPIPTERGPELAADYYQNLLQSTPRFDLVILGIGEDGHTASLFPGREFPKNLSVIPVRGAPKPPPERVSLTPTALGDSREILYLVTGKAKRAAVISWRRGEPIPINSLPDRPEDHVFIERSAYGESSME